MQDTLCIEAAGGDIYWARELEQNSDTPRQGTPDQSGFQLVKNISPISVA
jgi:hypothetical protein